MRSNMLLLSVQGLIPIHISDDIIRLDSGDAFGAALIKAFQSGHCTSILPGRLY